MTALVGVMNKRAAVMAADSALTVTRDGKTKIYNTENKIFQLSDHSVGVMIYDSMEFMSTPWDIIIRMYRKERGSKEFRTLRGYVDDFIQYLRDEEFFCNEEDQKDFLEIELYRYYRAVKNTAIDNANDEFNAMEDTDGVDEDALIKKHLLDCINRYSEICKDSGRCIDFENFTMKRLFQYSDALFDKLDNVLKEEELPLDMRSEWEQGFFKYIRSNEFRSSTGIVFIGYGSKDIYPSLIQTEIAGAFDDRLRYWVDEEQNISNDNPALVSPFAQKDVVFSLLKGINPSLRESVLDEHYESLLAAKEKMLTAAKELGVSSKVLDKLIEVDMDEIHNKYAETLSDNIQSNFVDGVVDAVDSFNVQDMISMAESLVSVTNLHRHMSSSEESVGGPVDVAVITKTEGFVWVKRKQWFDMDKNPQLYKDRR